MFIWLLRRNCSVTPLQLVWTYISLLCGVYRNRTFSRFQGATLVIPFASLELIAVGLAFLVYARHSTDGEHISLLENRLVVELECAGRLERAEFQRGWVRVEPRADDSSLIELSGGGNPSGSGDIQAELRPQLAKEIRSALRAV